MVKKFFKKYGYYMILLGCMLIMFVLGFIGGTHVISATTAGKASECYGAGEGAKITDREIILAATPIPTPKYEEMTVTATAYCACMKCCGKTDGITATGTKATAGRTIAVNPNVIPYGTQVIINGNTYVAEDCGGAIKGNDVDIFFNTHEEALIFGRQVLTAYILK